eukprot:6461175-Prymnesium_polylepis.1
MRPDRCTKQSLQKGTCDFALCSCAGHRVEGRLQDGRQVCRCDIHGTGDRGIDQLRAVGLLRLFRLGLLQHAQIRLGLINGFPTLPGHLRETRALGLAPIRSRVL